jgi:hypothetical protein
MARLGMSTINTRRIIIDYKRTGVNIGCVQTLRLGRSDRLLRYALAFCTQG